MSSLTKLNKEKSQKYKAQEQSNRWHDEFCKMRKQRDMWRDKYNELVLIHTDKNKQIRHLSEKLKECRCKKQSVMEKLINWINTKSKP